jgi:hypothetical protein
MEPDRKELLWCSVYASMVVAQVSEKWRLYGEAPTETNMRDYAEEAETIADMAIEARETTARVCKALG